MKKKKKKPEETYQITPKGLIFLAVYKGLDIWDELDLYCYRNGYNAILMTPEGGKFVNVEKGK